MYVLYIFSSTKFFLTFKNTFIFTKKYDFSIVGLNYFFFQLKNCKNTLLPNHMLLLEASYKGHCPLNPNPTGEAPTCLKFNFLLHHQKLIKFTSCKKFIALIPCHNLHSKGPKSNRIPTFSDLIKFFPHLK